MHQLGFELNTLIDSFTDSHPIVSQSKSVLKEKGYLKPVVIDVVYDHFLSKHWSSLTTIEMKLFLNKFDSDASLAESTMSSEAFSFVSRLIEYKVLYSYGDMQGLEQAFNRIDKRLSPKLRQKESMTDYLPLVEANYIQLESDFLEFFPELSEVVVNYIDSHEHYLI